MSQNPFQPWKQNFNNSSQFYRKNDCDILSSYNKMTKSSDAGTSANSHNMPHHFDSINGSNDGLQLYQHQSNLSMTNSCSSNSVSDSDPPLTPHQPSHIHQSSSTQTSTTLSQAKTSSQNSTTSSKFSIFAQLLNLNKIQSFDNLLMNATLDDDDLSNDKPQGIRKLMEQAISDEAKQQIAFILERISALRPAEKFLLYLKMPGGHLDVDPLKHSQNPLGSRSEITHTINWVRSHLEHDEKVSIPKQEVYEDYVSFCGKINIKPLSTADFGKVMKQVFPDIKPRRLGTRGHSRYCYAAMRKATKLQTPFLPDLSCDDTGTTTDELNDDVKADSWSKIKIWSENILNKQFNSIDDLASHITKLNQTLPNTSTSSSSSASKHALQKKILQREFRDKKKNNQNQSLSMKKRRKKQRRLSSDSHENTQEDYFNENICIKQEKETDGSAAENNISEDSSEVPMNLTNSSDLSKRDKDEISVNLITTQFDTLEKDDMRSKLNQKHDDDNIDQNQQEQYILCKKVRQAQQMKMSANNNMQTTSFIEPSNVTNITTETNDNDMMMMPTKIPAKRKLKKDVNPHIKKSKSTLNSTESESSSFDPQVEPNDLVIAKDELKEDFILPRERFISICNMDKNALDTYLNPSEENSPDLEMMQYFGEDKNSKNDSDEEDLGQVTTSVPLLENYQLVHESRNDNKTLDKITQLRSMLEEHNQKSMSESLIKSLLKNNLIEFNSNGSNQMTSYGTSGSCFLATSRSSSNNTFQKCSDDNNEKLVPQSPNTRRKNLSFVPISNSTRVRNINLHPAFKEEMGTSPFVSPRPSTITRRVTNSLSARNQNEMSEIDSKSNPIIGVNTNTAFCRPHQFKLEPVSAPESPSIIQNFNYSPQQTSSQNHFQFQPLNSNYNYPSESRSQSVPPHCTTNTNIYSGNSNNGYNGYSSTCSSMAPTPVPPEYQEFADSTILDIFGSEQQSSVVNPSSIKLEASDDVIDLLDNEILNQNSSGNQTTRQTFTNSRSVPSTPLPFHSNYSGNSMNAFCLSGKSVPTTPVAQNGTNPFRYSPELHTTRDFLINGFNNNNNNTAINHNEKLLKHDNRNLSNGIDDLSNIDTNCFNTL